MRCPYCQAVNQDQAIYCGRCGRDLRQPPPRQPGSMYQPPRQAPPPAARPASTVSARIRQPEIPAAPPLPVTPVMPPASESAPQADRPRFIVGSPEPPAPFPPRTVADLQALEQGALSYTVVNDMVDVGRKKIVRIAYVKCVPWQQIATLLKAYKEQQGEHFDTIIIQGVLPQDPGVYSFTNGQLRFDRDVRLGSLTTNRYQIETGNGYESDSLRIVLTEP